MDILRDNVVSRVKRSNCLVVSYDDDIAVIKDSAGVPDIVNMRILVNNVAANALIDTSSKLIYVNLKFVIANRFQRSNDSIKIGLVETGNCFKVKKFVCLQFVCKKLNLPRRRTDCS